MKGRRESRTSGQLLSWCGPVVHSTDHAPASGWSEAPGYVAMLAFLAAYLLNVAGVGASIQAALNVTGAVVAAVYLSHKKAIPSVISNLAWVVITIVGLLIG